MRSESVSFFSLFENLSVKREVKNANIKYTYGIPIFVSRSEFTMIVDIFCEAENPALLIPPKRSPASQPN